MITFVFLASLLLPAIEARGQDMSAVFAKLTTCSDCIGAGYGWCTIKRRCGGFANQQCGLGPQYIAEPASAAPKKKSQPKRAPSPPPQPSGGTDMRATFAKLTTCSDCIGAGYGWCTNLRKCGGFANKQCGIGPRYIAADAAPDEPPAAAPKMKPTGRNGLWESKSQRQQTHEAEAPPVAEVPPADKPKEAPGLLYAGPVKRVVVDAASGAAAKATSTVTVAPSALSNESSVAAAEEARAALMQLPTEALVSKVMELEAVIASMKKAAL